MLDPSRSREPAGTVLTAPAIDALANELVQQAHQQKPRFILGIVGIPGSGKSTLANELIQRMPPGCAALAPMDGFHLDNEQLDQRHLRDRKGAPETFHAQRYIDLLRRLGDPHATMYCPAYDRTLHEPTFNDDPHYQATANTRLVIAEGNYLLIRQQPWLALEQVLDQTWWIDLPMERAKTRLMQRHRAGGRSLSQSTHRCEHDLRNGRFVLDQSGHADRVMRWP